MNILRLSTFSLTLAIAVFALGYANPSFAAPKKCDVPNPETIPGCGGGGGDKTVATFDVLLTGPVSGNNTSDWLRFSSRGVGGSDPHSGAFTLNLNAFLVGFLVHDDEDICFAAIDTIRGGHVRERKQGSAEVVLLIDGKTFDDPDDDVVYRLLMTAGPGAIPDNWLPIKNSAATITLTDWKLGVAGSQSPELEPRSCAGAGSFDPSSLSVTVTRTN